MERYDAETDKNLSRYFANPVRQRHIQRAKALERLERTPSFYRHLVSLCRTQSAAMEPCLCSSTFVCVFCTGKQRRVDILEGGEILSPLRLLLQEIAPPMQKRPQSRTQGTSRPQSAAPRPASAMASRTVSATPRPPSSTPRPLSAAMIPSRPTSAVPAVTGASSRPGSAVDHVSMDPLPADLHHFDPMEDEHAARGVKSELVQGTPKKRAGPKKKPKLIVGALSLSSGGTKHVHFDSASTKIAPVASDHQPKRPIEVDELTFAELLNADARVFEAAQTSPDINQVLVERMTATIKASASEKETVRLEVVRNNDHRSHSVDCQPPAQTFLLIRFTAEQFGAATRIQAFYRGCRARKQLRRRLHAARKIQRRVRSFLEGRSTAVAVWALERHGGRWCPTSKFTQIANSHTLTRPKASTSTRVVPGECSAIQAHERDVLRLSSMISMMCSESKDRVSLLTERHEEMCSFVSSWVPLWESHGRRSLHQVESSERVDLQRRFMLEAKYASQRKTLLYKHEAIRSDLLREHRAAIVAVCCQLNANLENELRLNISKNEAVARLQMISEFASSGFYPQMKSISRSELLQREELDRFEVVACWACTALLEWESFAIRCSVNFTSDLFVEESAFRSGLIVHETAQRVIAAFV